MRAFDTAGTHEPICPYCGRAVEDAWELRADADVIECGWCGKEFKYRRTIIEYFTTEKLPEDKERK